MDFEKYKKAGCDDLVAAQMLSMVRISPEQAAIQISFEPGKVDTVGAKFSRGEMTIKEIFFVLRELEDEQENTFNCRIPQ